MKRLIEKITAISLMVILSISIAGCGLFNVESNKGSIEDLPPSTETESVTFTTKETDRTKKDKVEVIENVRRSIVAIVLKTGNGTTSGSGIIVDMNKEGDSDNIFYILTCHHVISGMGEVTVYIPDRESDNFGEEDYDESFVFTGKIGPQIFKGNSITLIGGDKVSDTALLKLDISGQTTVKKEDIVESHFPSSKYEMKVGEDVIAIGNPSGRLPGTVSVGTISYLGRETTIEDVGAMTLTQINVDIYHGSSGGGLFNLYGELIGMTNGGSDSYSGLNYAIPYAVERTDDKEDRGFVNVAVQLLASKTDNNYGYITGRVGTFGLTVTEESVGTIKTVEVTSIIEGSIAEKSGLKVGDIIYKVIVGRKDGLEGASEVKAISDVNKVFTSVKAGEFISMQVQRKEGWKFVAVDIEMEAVPLIFCDTGNYTK